MWWPTATDPLFSASPARTAIGEAYAAQAGVERSLAGYLLPGLNTLRRLPGLFALRVTTVDGRSFVISVDAEKGIRLHFNRENTPAEHRNAVWSSFASFVRQYRSLRESSLFSRMAIRLRRPGSDPWWRQTEQVVMVLEAGNEPPQAIGSLFLE
jgi:hypothetical protein